MPDTSTLTQSPTTTEEALAPQSTLTSTSTSILNSTPATRPLTKTPKALVAFNTLGCKLNQYESDALASRFLDEGYGIVPFEAGADVYIINSCTVTNKADRKSRNLLARAERFARGAGSARGDTADSAGSEHSPLGASAMVVLTGCYVDSHRDELESRGRTFVVDNDHKNNIFELVDAHLRGEVFHPQESIVDRFLYSTGRQVFRTRGMLKVQDGCDNFCSFCIIPFVRGRALSRPVESIVKSAQEMLNKGYRELVLTGVNMSRYSDSGHGFSDLLERLLNLEVDVSSDLPVDVAADAGDARAGAQRHGAPGAIHQHAQRQTQGRENWSIHQNKTYRLRISSIEPDQIDDKFIHLLGHERMTPHLHLCLQTASERLLLSMRRQYTYSEYRGLVERIRERYANFNITSDIIVGFPGEGEAEFEATLRAVRELNFGHVHVFPYSVRRGTRAERMPGHVSDELKARRSALLRQEAEAVKRGYRSGFVGKVQTVLVERVEKVEEAEEAGQAEGDERGAVDMGKQADLRRQTDLGGQRAGAIGHRAQSLGSGQGLAEPSTVGGRYIARGFGEHYLPIRLNLPDPLPQFLQGRELMNTFLPVRIRSIAEGEDPELIAELLL